MSQGFTLGFATSTLRVRGTEEELNPFIVNTQ